MDPFYIEDLPRKNSMNLSSPSQAQRFQEESTPRKKFKNNEILSSYSSTKRSFTANSMNQIERNIDPMTPVPLKRKRVREDSNEDETPSKKSKRIVVTNSVGVQTESREDSVGVQTESREDSSFLTEGDHISIRDETSTGTPESGVALRVRRTRLVVPEIPSQIKSPLRCFTMEEHALADKKREARLRRYMDTIRKNVLGPQPKFYEPPAPVSQPKFYEPPAPVSAKPAAPVVNSEPLQPNVPSLPIVSTSSEAVTDASESPKVTKHVTFSFGSSTTSTATTTALTTSSAPFAFSIPSSSSASSTAITSTTTTSVGSIVSATVQPPASSSAVNFSFKPVESAQPAVPFSGFSKTEPPAFSADSTSSGSPIPGRKFVRGNRRLGPKVEGSNPGSTAATGFASFSFPPTVTTQAPTFGAPTASQAPTFGAPTASQAPVFGSTSTAQPPPPSFGVATAAVSQPSVFGSSSAAPTFTFGQQSQQTTNPQPVNLVSGSSQPFTFGAPNPAPRTFGASNPAPPTFGASNPAPPTFGSSSLQAPAFGTSTQNIGTAPTFGATQGTTFNAQLPTSFNFGGGNVSASLSNLNSTAGSLFAPAGPGTVVKGRTTMAKRRQYRR